MLVKVVYMEQSINNFYAINAYNLYVLLSGSRYIFQCQLTDNGINGAHLDIEKMSRMTCLILITHVRKDYIEKSQFAIF